MRCTLLGSWPLIGPPFSVLSALAQMQLFGVSAIYVSDCELGHTGTKMPATSLNRYDEMVTWPLELQTDLAKMRIGFLIPKCADNLLQRKAAVDHRA